MTAKQAPIFDGRASWFRFEEAVDEWVAITSIADSAKWGPMLRARLAGDALPYKELMDMNM